jgi:hypothetical protein
MDVVAIEAAFRLCHYANPFPALIQTHLLVSCLSQIACHKGASIINFQFPGSCWAISSKDASIFGSPTSVSAAVRITSIFGLFFCSKTISATAVSTPNALW